MWICDCRVKCRTPFLNRWSWNRVRCFVRTFELPSIMSVGGSGRGSDYVMSELWANLGDLTWEQR